MRIRIKKKKAKRKFFYWNKIKTKKQRNERRENVVWLVKEHSNGWQLIEEAGSSSLQVAPWIKKQLKRECKERRKKEKLEKEKSDELQKSSQ